MSGKPRRRLPPAAGASGIERLEMQEFARKLHDLRTSKGMSQSDLARAVWGETTDTKGNRVAKNRDRISQYEMGKSIPEPHNLVALAEALDVDAKELAPEVVAAAVDREEPEIQIVAVRGHPDKVHVIVNTLTSMATAAQIMALLTNELANSI